MAWGSRGGVLESCSILDEAERDAAVLVVTVVILDGLDAGLQQLTTPFVVLVHRHGGGE